VTRHIPDMPIVPLYGHAALRERLLAHVRSGSLPQCLLFSGPAGAGKQRLALWLAQALLCPEPDAPCGTCQHCRFALELSHPDLFWVFPRPRPKESESDPADVAMDLAEVRRERAARHGLYPTSPGVEGLFVSTVRYLVHEAAKTPAMARRKVIIVGEIDRMVPQEGFEYAANAFLKLLEEPPADTWIIVTTSAVGALLPTIRSRVVAVRVPTVDEAGVRAFLNDPAVAAALDELGLPRSVDDRVRLAQGTPGALLSSSVRREAAEDAERFVEAAISGDQRAQYQLALSQGQRGARGAFADVLHALTFTLHHRLRTHAVRQDESGAQGASRAIDAVEDAKRLAEANVNPQLIAVKLLEDLSTNLS
jgi:DNA polymerase-3 subunit delta'